MHKFPIFCGVSASAPVVRAVFSMSDNFRSGAESAEDLSEKTNLRSQIEKGGKDPSDQRLSPVPRGLTESYGDRALGSPGAVW